LTASKDNTVRTWPATGGRALAVIDTGAGTVKTASFSPDGTRILTASDDGRLGIWSTAGGGLLFYVSHERPVQCARFSRFGDRIITATSEGPVRVIPLDPRSHAKKRILRSPPVTEYQSAVSDKDKGESPPAFNATQDDSWSGQSKNGDVAGLCPAECVEVRADEIMSKGKPEPLLFVSQRRRGLDDKAGKVEYHSSLWSFDPLKEDHLTEIFVFGKCRVPQLTANPAGNRLGFIESQYNGAGQRVRSIVKSLSLRTGEELPRAQILCNTKGLVVDYIDWGCENRIILATRPRNAGAWGGRICLIDPDGIEDQTLQTLLFRPGQTFACPTISKDGKQIGFVHFAGMNDFNRWDVWIGDFAGDSRCVVRPRSLAVQRRFAELLCRFSFDSRWIYAFRSSDRNGEGAPCLVRIGSAERREEVLIELSNKNQPCQFSIAPSGLLAVAVDDGRGKTTRILIVNRPEKKITALSVENLAGDWDSVSSPCFVSR